MAIGISGYIEANFKEQNSTDLKDTIVISSFSGQKSYKTRNTAYVKYLCQAIDAGSIISIYVDRDKGNIAFGVNNWHVGFAYTDVPFLKNEDLYLTFHAGWKE